MLTPNVKSIQIISFWMVGWVDGWMEGWVDGWRDGWMDGGMGGWVEGWVDGWRDGWMDVVFNRHVKAFFFFTFVPYSILILSKFHLFTN